MLTTRPFIQTEKELHLETDGQKKVVLVTGGGAYKYAELFEQRLGVKFQKLDEMACLISGLNFFLERFFLPRHSFQRTNSLLFSAAELILVLVSQNSVPYESYTFSPDPEELNPRAFVPVEVCPTHTLTPSQSI